MFLFADEPLDSPPSKVNDSGPVRFLDHIDRGLLTVMASAAFTTASVLLVEAIRAVALRGLKGLQPASIFADVRRHRTAWYKFSIGTTLFLYDRIRVTEWKHLAMVGRQLLEAVTRPQQASTAGEAAELICETAKALLGGEEIAIYMPEESAAPDTLFALFRSDRETFPSAFTCSQEYRDKLQTEELIFGGVGGVPLVLLPLKVGSTLIGVMAVHRASIQLKAFQAARAQSFTAALLAQALQFAMLEAAAQTDALTLLANRRSFWEALMAIEPGSALAIIDLDHFKRVNDQYGHEVGDRVIAAMGETLRRIQADDEVMGRIGGEEFAIIVHARGNRSVEKLLEEVRDAWWQSAPLTTFSAGTARYTAGDPLATLREADIALYQAKQRGRNKTVCS